MYENSCSFIVGSYPDEVLKENNFDIKAVCSNVAEELTPAPVNLHIKGGVVPEAFH